MRRCALSIVTRYKPAVTFVKDLITVDSAGPIDRAGQAGLRAGTIPGATSSLRPAILPRVFTSPAVVAAGESVPMQVHFLACMHDRELR
jgi:hypothetical protein